MPEVTEAFEDVVLVLSRSIKFDGGKLRPGHVLNALIYAFALKDAAEQEYVTAEAVARLELLLAESDEEKQAAAERLKAIREEGRAVSVAKRNETEAHVNREKERKRAPRKARGKKDSGQGHGHGKGSEGSGIPRAVG